MLFSENYAGVREILNENFDLAEQAIKREFLDPALSDEAENLKLEDLQAEIDSYKDIVFTEIAKIYLQHPSEEENVKRVRHIAYVEDQFSDLTKRVCNQALERVQAQQAPAQQAPMQQAERAEDAEEIEEEEEVEAEQAPAQQVGRAQLVDESSDSEDEEEELEEPAPPEFPPFDSQIKPPEHPPAA